jgi:hypothetical protein
VIALTSQFTRLYSSDSAYTAGVLLAFGLVGIFSSMWMRLAG